MTIFCVAFVLAGRQIGADPPVGHPPRLHQGTSLCQPRTRKARPTSAVRGGEISRYADVRQEHVTALAPPRPVVPLGPSRPGQSQPPGDARIGQDLDDAPICRTGAPRQEPVDLTVQGPAFHGPAGALEPPAQLGEALIDALQEAGVDRLLLLAALPGSDEDERPGAVGPVRAARSP